MSATGPTERDFERLRARLEGSLASISGSLAEYKETQKKSDARTAEFEEKREKAARSGELGPQWQRLQQRIDLKQTTLADVFEGRDDSPEARALLQQSRQTLSQVAADLDESDDDEAEETPVEEVQRMHAAFEARAAQFRRMNLEGER